MRTTTTAVAAAALVLGLTGCSVGDTGGSTAPPRSSSGASTPAPTAAASGDTSGTPSADGTTATTEAHTAEELSAVFRRIQFEPGEFDTTDAMLDSVYPGLTVSDASCLAPFGVGWDGDDTSGPIAFGTSNDRSMTAVVASTGDVGAATDLVGDARDALTRCADGSELFTMDGQRVETTVAPMRSTLTGTDESLGWRIRGTVGGAPFTLVGLTGRVGGDVVALVGWDPASNTTNVPLASQMFVDDL